MAPENWTKKAKVGKGAVYALEKPFDIQKVRELLLKIAEEIKS